ncbi:MAG: methyltransferase domain-containing protein [Flavobacteriales bacterium]|nr:methyltransferase domain-containing protein [Flavobacteriales bacterium]
MSRAHRRVRIDRPFFRDTQDLYHVRSTILRALTSVLSTWHGILPSVACRVKPCRPLTMAPPARGERCIGLDFKVDDDPKDNCVRPDPVRGDVTIPLADTRVDRAFAAIVLEHCPDPLALLRERNRVMRPGALVLITVPFLWLLQDAPYDERRYTPFAIRRLLQSAGSVDAQVHATGGWDASLGRMIGLWLIRWPLPRPLRAVLKVLSYPVVRLFVRGDRVAEEVDRLMITALWATARRS